MKKNPFTTSDIAGICHVSGETAKRWVEEGKIKGYRVGTSGHWRVLPKDLVLFLKNDNIPFPEPAEIGIDLTALAHIEGGQHTAGDSTETKRVITFALREPVRIASCIRSGA